MATRSKAKATATSAPAPANAPASAQAAPSLDALSPAQVANKALGIGTTKAKLSLSRMFCLAVLAGLYIALGAASMLIVKADSSFSFAVSQVLSGIVFSVGLFLVVNAGAELFTGNSLMVIAALERKITPAELIRAWLVVYLGNLVGSLLLAVLLDAAGFDAMGGRAVAEAAANIASSKAGLSPLMAFSRGIVCNILVCLAVWMSFAARSVIDKFAVCLLPVMTFVACGYEHSIANMFFLPFGIMCGAEVGAAQVLSNLCFVTLGNIVGGALFVGCSYWFIYLKGQES